MKPLNLNKESCNPISSNCVVWQGPDIECINLCKGDSVTEVVFKLACELCELLEMFKVSNYDISCFNLLECDPKDFAALIQLLIDRVCACCQYDPCTDTYITPTAGQVVVGTTTGSCPDCIVTVCPDFYYVNPQGDTVTTMQVQDYAVAIGNKVCQMIGQIDTINATLINHEDRIEILESAPAPTVTLPQVTPDCVLPSVATDMNLVLSALESQFCQLQVATGNPTAIYEAMLKQCAGLNASNQLSGTGTMQDIPGWSTATSTMADTVNNLWLTICDIRSGIQTIQANCCDTGCDGIVIAINAVLNNSNELQIYFTGSVPANFSDCSGGSQLVLTDALGGTSTYTENIILNYLNVPSGFIASLSTGPVNGNYDVTAVLTLCALDPTTGTTCQTVATSVATSALACPTLQLTPGYLDVQFNFNHVGPTPVETIAVELYDLSQSTLISTQIFNTTYINEPIGGLFTGLTSNTQYYVRVVPGGIPANGACPFASVTTLNELCNPPTNGSIIEL